MGVRFENKVIFHRFREVKWPQDCSKTLLLDVQCLNNTYRGLKDGLAFDVVSPGLGQPNLFTMWS